jgi:hypothetical protein
MGRGRCGGAVSQRLFNRSCADIAAVMVNALRLEEASRLRPLGAHLHQACARARKLRNVAVGVVDLGRCLMCAPISIIKLAAGAPARATAAPTLHDCAGAPEAAISGHQVSVACVGNPYDDAITSRVGGGGERGGILAPPSPQLLPTVGCRSWHHLHPAPAAALHSHFTFTAHQAMVVGETY